MRLKDQILSLSFWGGSVEDLLGSYVATWSSYSDDLWITQELLYFNAELNMSLTFISDFGLGNLPRPLAKFYDL